MISVKVEGVEEFKGYLEAQRKNQLPFALSTGLNDVAFEVRTKQIELIQSTFDRPKPQTAKNVFVKKATKQNLRAVILFDQIYNRGIDEYMEANIEGGSRKMKPSEQRLGRFYVPGAGAKMDQYGNMQGGQIPQILSRLGRFGDVAGYDMNETLRSRLRRTGAKKTLEYFVVTKLRGGLAPGIYQRIQSSTGFGAKTTKNLSAGSFQKGRTVGKFSSVIRGRGIIPVVLFTKKAPAYKAVWPFFKAAQDLVNARYKPAIEQRIDQALRTAR